jgi:cytochrome c
MQTLHLILAATMPVPRDLPLPLPIGETELKLLIVPLFLLHILFVNLTVGASLLGVIFEAIGRRNERYDTLARRIAETITVNKSLAVVMGVGPLLVMNLLYTVHFYTANVLTGHAWAMLVPLVTAAFLLAYLHKYTWDRWTGRRKGLHQAVGVASCLLFLLIPLIFLANVNLMLFPDKWAEVPHFLASLRIGNVFPRYAHFLASSTAITTLFLVLFFGRRSVSIATLLPGFTRPELLRCFYRWTLFVSLGQFVVGPLLLFTLPPQGISAHVLVPILGGATLAVLALLAIGYELRMPAAHVGTLRWPIALILSSVAFFMGLGRHEYREGALAEHKALIADRTATWRSIELAAQMRLASGLGIGDAIGGPPTPKQLAMACLVCHARDSAVSAPSLREIHSIYHDNPAGIVTWAKAPGKKRAQYGQMPSMAHMGDEKLTTIAEYLLQLGAADAAAPAQPK